MSDDELELDEPVMVMVDEFDTEAEANEAGATLVEKGIGAVVEPIPAEELADGGSQEGYRVKVLEHELRRAEEALGLVEPEDRPPANPEEPMKYERPKTNWKAIALVWVAAAIILPVIAFLATYQIMKQ